MEKLLATQTPKGEFPELFYNKGEEIVHNENTPLGWSQAMYLVAVA